MYKQPYPKCDPQNGSQPKDMKKKCLHLRPVARGLGGEDGSEHKPIELLQDPARDAIASQVIGRVAQDADMSGGHVRAAVCAQ